MGDLLQLVLDLFIWLFDDRINPRVILYLLIGLVILILAIYAFS